MQQGAILDISTQRFGVLAPEISDVWHEKELYPSEWKTRLLGMEFHVRSRKSPLPRSYTFEGDPMDILPTAVRKIGLMDICIVADLLEYLDPHTALNILEMTIATSQEVILRCTKNFAPLAERFPHELLAENDEHSLYLLTPAAL